MSATDAAAFLTEHVAVHHCQLLSTILPDNLICQLMTSTQAQLALLRALRPSLPTTADLKTAAAKAVALRIPFKDGYIDTKTHSFHPLPFITSHFVTAVLPFCYADVARASHADTGAGTKLLASWFSDPGELQYLIRQLSRALAPKHGDTQKSIVMYVDTLGQQEGNRGKSTFLTRVIHGILGTTLCTVSHGDCLTCGQSSTYLKRRGNVPHPVSVEAFDELSTGNTSAKQLDAGALKHMSGGTANTSNLLMVACNPSNLPDLLSLQQSDPALLSRLVMLPARGVFTEPVPGFAAKVERLLPALCKLLLDDHKLYLKEGTLPPCATMDAHKQLLTRSTHIPHGLTQPHVHHVKEWLQQHIVAAPGHVLMSEALDGLFISRHTDQLMFMHKQISKGFALVSMQSMVRGLVDAAMARMGHSMSQGCYQGVAWRDGDGVTIM